MFSNAGFQITSNQKVSDALVDNLIISGNDATVAARFNELLAVGLDELMISLVPITETGDDEQALLTHLIGRL